MMLFATHANAVQRNASKTFSEETCIGSFGTHRFFLALITTIWTFFVHKMLSFNQYVSQDAQIVLLHYWWENIPPTKITFQLMSQSNGPWPHSERWFMSQLVPQVCLSRFNFRAAFMLIILAHLGYSYTMNCGSITWNNFSVVEFVSPGLCTHSCVPRSSGDAVPLITTPSISPPTSQWNHSPSHTEPRSLCCSLSAKWVFRGNRGDFHVQMSVSPLPAITGPSSPEIRAWDTAWII